ncbi:hypothetical protein KR054_009745, partial [Drosophila jambulina]
KRTDMAYKNVCLELETPSTPETPAVAVPPPTSVATLRASATEFVPQVPLASDRVPTESEDEQEEYSDDERYNVERTAMSPKPASYGLRFYNSHYEPENGSDSHSVEAEKKRKFSYRTPKFRPNLASCGRVPKVEATFLASAKPPKELASGQPHFKGPYMPLLQHRIANADAYGLIRAPNERSSMMLDDMVKQLARLDHCPFNLNTLFRNRGPQNPLS